MKGVEGSDEDDGGASGVRTRELHNRGREEVISTLFVDGISEMVGYSQIRALFALFGSLGKVFVQRVRKIGRRYRFGFVQFRSKGSAETAMTRINGLKVGGNHISVTMARFPFDQGAGASQRIGLEVVQKGVCLGLQNQAESGAGPPLQGGADGRRPDDAEVCLAAAEGGASDVGIPVEFLFPEICLPLLEWSGDATPAGIPSSATDVGEACDLVLVHPGNQRMFGQRDIDVRGVEMIDVEEADHTNSCNLEMEHCPESCRLERELNPSPPRAAEKDDSRSRGRPRQETVKGVNPSCPSCESGRKVIVGDCCFKRLKKKAEELIVRGKKEGIVYEDDDRRIGVLLMQQWLQESGIVYEGDDLRKVVLLMQQWLKGGDAGGMQAGS